MTMLTVLILTTEMSFLQDFDWYSTFNELQIFFDRHEIPKDSKILIVGAGTSHLGDELVKKSYKDVTNIDISSVVIRTMKEEYPDQVWLEMDASKMSFPDNTFDLVIDKGTFDALVCSDSSKEIANGMLDEILRVCKSGTGRFMMVSHSRFRDKFMFMASARHLGPEAEKALEEWENAAENLLSSVDESDSGGATAKAELLETLEFPKKLEQLRSCWEVVEAAKCELSPEASLVNIMRSALPKGKQLRTVMNTPVLMAAVRKCYKCSGSDGSSA